MNALDGVRAGVLAGDGVVGRSSHGLVVLHGDPATVAGLLTEADPLTATGIDRLRELAARGLPTGIAGLVVVTGGADALLVTSAGPEHVGVDGSEPPGDHHGEATVRVVRDPGVVRLGIAIGQAGAALDLREGVVPGAGVVLVRRSGAAVVPVGASAAPERDGPPHDGPPRDRAPHPVPAPSPGPAPTPARTADVVAVDGSGVATVPKPGATDGHEPAPGPTGANTDSTALLQMPPDTDLTAHPAVKEPAAHAGQGGQPRAWLGTPTSGAAPAIAHPTADRAGAPPAAPHGTAAPPADATAPLPSAASGAPTDHADEPAPAFTLFDLSGDDVDPGRPLPIATAEPADTAEFAELVPSVLCPRQHVNHPLARACQVCALSLQALSEEPVERPRPTLGFIVFDDGMTFALDRSYIIGRQAQQTDGALVTPLVIDDAEHSVSRRHAELLLDDWDVVVRDAGSSNGTRTWDPTTASWHRLSTGEPLALRPGTYVAVGRRVFVYESSLRL